MSSWTLRAFSCRRTGAGLLRSGQRGAFGALYPSALFLACSAIDTGFSTATFWAGYGYRVRCTYGMCKFTFSERVFGRYVPSARPSRGSEAPERCRGSPGWARIRRRAKRCPRSPSCPQTAHGPLRRQFPGAMAMRGCLRPPRMPGGLRLDESLAVVCSCAAPPFADAVCRTSSANSRTHAAPLQHSIGGTRSHA